MTSRTAAQSHASTAIGDTVHHFASMSGKKSASLSSDPLGFMLSAAKAGAYVGVGIILIFTLGQAAEPAWRSLVMGASFGIALTLVIFAGSELFTGHAMYGAHGVLTRTIGVAAVLRLWAASWIGNLIGAMLLATLFLVGIGSLLAESEQLQLVQTVVAKKMHTPALSLIAKGMLCNWLVCLSIWTSARTSNDVAKCILIFWCLFAFIASGFEHSVANMTVFSLALFSAPGDGVTWAGAAHNLLWVTFGNILSGTLVMGWGYWRIAGRPRGATP